MAACSPFDAGDVAASSDGGPSAPSADGASAYVAAVTADAPLAWYRFEEAGGTVAKDAVGQRDGTYEGTFSFGELGIGGSRAVRFDGETSRVTAQHRAFGFGGGAPFSVELWFRPEVVDDRVRRLFDRGAPSDTSGYLVQFHSGTILTEMRGVDGGTAGYADGPAPSVGAYHHLVVTYDGAKMRLYVNGGLAGEGNGGVDVGSPEDALLVIGDIVSTSYFKYQGLVDELAIYDKALLPNRVAAHFAAGP